MNQKTVGVQSFLDAHRFSGFQIFVAATVFLVMFLDGFDTAAISYIAPYLQSEWGIAKKELTPVLTAALFGLALGAFSSGPLADRLGRRPVVILSVLIFGIFCWRSAYAQSLHALVVWRFLTGIGLGAAMPNVVTLLAEFCPTTLRPLVVNSMSIGFPIGVAAGGLLSTYLIPHFGWRSVLVLGGLAPLLLAAVMVILLPESPRFLALQSDAQEHLRRILRRIDFALPQDVCFSVDGGDTPNRRGLQVIFNRDYRLGTLLFWTIFFMGLVIFYGMVNWMPTLFHHGILPPNYAPVITSLFALGALGAIFNGWLMKRFNHYYLVAAMVFLAALFTLSIGFALKLGVAAVVASVLLSGLAMNTAQASIFVLAAEFYPTEGRTTGMSWMMGVGRFGAIAGSVLLGLLVAHQFSLITMFAVLALPMVISGCCLLLLARVHRRIHAQELGNDDAG